MTDFIPKSQPKSKYIIWVLGAVFVTALLLLVNFSQKANVANKAGDILNSASIVETVSAEEIYPLFVCPCCGKAISAGCCGMAKERQVYVDGLVEGNLSKDKIIETYVKKYGLNSFKDEDKKEEFRQKLVQSAPEDRPIIILSPETYNFGDVSQKKGDVETLFELKNSGKSDLIINKLETSCGCTSASIVYQGKEGPRFAMPGHGVNEKVGDWQARIASGETAQLKVYYDPNAHKEFRGAAIRSISVFSNDPIDFEKKVSIELNQVE